MRVYSYRFMCILRLKILQMVVTKSIWLNIMVFSTIANTIARNWEQNIAIEQPGVITEFVSTG